MTSGLTRRAGIGHTAVDLDGPALVEVLQSAKRRRRQHERKKSKAGLIGIVHALEQKAKA
jgi:hypothetical protein